jgi:hypothetical protein
MDGPPGQTFPAAKFLVGSGGYREQLQPAATDRVLEIGITTSSGIRRLDGSRLPGDTPKRDRCEGRSRTLQAAPRGCGMGTRTLTGLCQHRPRAIQSGAVADHSFTRKRAGGLRKKPVAAGFGD